MKKWYRSKTMWFNTAIAVLAILDQITVSGVLISYPVIIPIVAAVNLVLRSYTKEAVVK